MIVLAPQKINQLWEIAEHFQGFADDAREGGRLTRDAAVYQTLSALAQLLAEVLEELEHQDELRRMQGN